MTWLFALALGVGLWACASGGVEPDADRTGRTFIDAVQRADWPAMDRTLAPQVMADPTHAAKIEAIRALFPPDPPWSIKLLKSSRDAGWRRPTPEHTSLQYLYGFAGRSLVIDVVVEAAGEKTVVEKPVLAGSEPSKKIVKLFKVDDLQARVAEPRLVAGNAFWGPAKTPLQWSFLVATFAMPLVMLGTAIAALLTKGLERRWVWMILAFVGVGSVWMNWTTGAVGHVWAAVNLLGFGVTKAPSPLDPWMLRFTSPVGALIVVLRLVILARSRRPTT